MATVKKQWKRVAVHSKTHRALVQLMGELQAEYRKKFTFSDTINHLIHHYRKGD